MSSRPLASSWGPDSRTDARRAEREGPPTAEGGTTRPRAGYGGALRTIYFGAALRRLAGPVDCSGDRGARMEARRRRAVSGP